jgi:hypothetical protein
MPPATPASYAPIRVVSHVILLLMLAAIGYAAYIAIIYWTGIGV